MAKAETNTYADPEATPEAEKRHNTRTPVVPAMNCAGIPAPAIRRAVEPAAVMIGGPAPGIVADPSPSVPVDPRPPAISVRRPSHSHSRRPHISIWRNVRPAAVIVQVFGAVNIATQIVIAARTLEVPVSPFVPLIPFVLADCVYDTEFGIAGRAPRKHGLSGAQPFAAASRKDLGLAGSNRNLRGAILIHRDAVYAPLYRPHRDTRSADFNIGFLVAKHAKCHGAACDLDGVSPVLELGEPNFGVRREANHVRPVELDLCAGTSSGKNPVLAYERRVDRGGDEIARIATLHRNITIQQTDPAHSTARPFIV